MNSRSTSVELSDVGGGRRDPSSTPARGETEHISFAYEVNKMLSRYTELNPNFRIIGLTTAMRVIPA
jgi:hypothetical protein